MKRKGWDYMMDKYQIAALSVLAVYYIAYLVKLLSQRKKGIQTSQLGKGKKDTKTMIIEKVLSVVSVATVIGEVVSVIFNDSFHQNSVVKWSGILMAACGTCIFILAMFTMQDSWRAGITSKDRTRLVTSGIYKISRNPAFLGFDFVYIGIGISFFNPVLTVISVLGIVMMHLQIIEEEAFLLKSFGEEYQVYKQSVRRYLGRK